MNSLPLIDILCTKCDKSFPATEQFFHRQTSTKRGWYAWCKTCVSAHQHKPDVQAKARSQRLVKHPHKSYDMTGQIFGRLQVVSFAYTDDHGRSYWNCQCDCGQVKVTSRRNLLSRDTQSCGCLWKETRKLIVPNKKAVGESAFNQLLFSYKKSARERGYTFELDEETFRLLTKSECFYCGCPPNRPAPRAKGTNGDYLCSGIDRIDNTKGYTIGNVRPCCKQCNIAKGVLPEQDFFNWIEQVAAYTAARQARFEHSEKGHRHVR